MIVNLSERLILVAHPLVLKDHVVALSKTEKVVFVGKFVDIMVIHLMAAETLYVNPKNFEEIKNVTVARSRDDRKDIS